MGDCVSGVGEVDQADFIGRVTGCSEATGYGTGLDLRGAGECPEETEDEASDGYGRDQGDGDEDDCC